MSEDVNLDDSEKIGHIILGALVVTFTVQICVFIHLFNILTTCLLILLTFN